MLKYHKVLIVLMLVFTAELAWSQQDKSFFHYDSITLKHYQDKEWKDLIHASKNAIQEGTDYYYLRMRRGIAFYEMENYLKAYHEFKIALEFNTFVTTAKEYAYLSLLYSGRTSDALLFYKNCLEGTGSEIINPKRPLRSISVDFSWHQNEKLNTTEFFENIESKDMNGKQMVTRSWLFADFFLEHDISKRISLFHGGSYLNKENCLFIKNAGEILENENYPLNQYQYYTGLNYNMGSGFSINAIGHLIHYNSPSASVRQRGPGNSYTISSIKKNELLLRLSLYKSANLFRIGAGYAHSEFNGRDQDQVDLTLICYPLGNLNFYVVGSLSSLNEKTRGQETNNRLVGRGMSGVRLMKNLWLEMDIYFGKIKNMALNEGYLIYNGPETINYTGTMSLIIPMKKINYTLRGSLVNYTSKFIDSSSMETEFNNYIFNGLSLTGGIKWNF